MPPFDIERTIASALPTATYGYVWAPGEGGDFLFTNTAKVKYSSHSRSCKLIALPGAPISAWLSAQSVATDKRKQTKKMNQKENKKRKALPCHAYK